MTGTGVLERELGTGGPWRWRRPDGGFYLWLRRAGGADTRRLALCFGNVRREGIAEGVSRLGRMLGDAFVGAGRWVA